MQLPTELALLTRCCAAAYGAPSPDLHDLADVDWHRLVALARFHRVQGLVWREVARIKSNIPTPVAAELAQNAKQIAAQNLKSAHEAQRLLQLFTAADIPLIFVKGATLGVLAYGDPWVKAAVDIDVLIAPDDLARAAQLLRGAGYSPGSPIAPQRLAQAHRWGKESSWLHTSTGLQVDLHTRLSDNPLLIPNVGLQSPQQLVAIADGISLPTLTDAFLVPYLAVHGASSAWFRLKWVVDFAAMLHRLGSDGLEAMYEQARSLGTGRAIDQGLLVAEAVMGSLREVPDLKARLLADRSNRWLAAAALRMVAAAEPREPTQVRGGTLPIHYSQLLLHDDLRFKASELWRQARAAITD